jgi:hypothetical protein
MAEYFSETPPPPPQEPIPWLVPNDATGAAAAARGPAFVTLDTVRRELVSLRSPGWFGWKSAGMSGARSEPVTESEWQRAVEQFARAAGFALGTSWALARLPSN